MSQHDFRLPFLAAAALAAVAGAQTGAGLGDFRAPNQPDPLDPGPRSFSVRVEPRPDFVRTRGTTFVNVPGAASKFVAHEDSTNVSVTFSAEAYSTSETGSVFVRALLDGEPMEPGDVVFARGSFIGVQTFSFAGLVHTGIHSVEIQWNASATSDSFVRDSSLLIKTGKRSGGDHSLTWVVPPSGPAQQTSSGAWGDVPGCTLDFYVPQKGANILSFSAESYVAFSTGGNQRMFVRALVDGVPAAPQDVVFTESVVPESRQMNFGVNGLAPGWHSARIQWRSANGGIVYLADRSLAVSSAPASTIAGHYFKSPPSGATLVKSDNQWESIPGLSISPQVPENGEIAVSVSAEVKTDPGAILKLRLLDNGAVVSDAIVTFTSHEALFESRTFTFDAKHVFAPGGAGGTQTLAVQWCAVQGNAYMGDRSMAVYVEPGDYPDLAEAAPFGWLPLEPAIGVRNVLTILHDADNTAPFLVKPPVADFAEALYGNRGVRDYFEVVSGERFSIANAGIVGWVPALQNEAHYWSPHDCNGPNADGFTGGHQERWYEAIVAADAVIDFASYDANQDGILHPQELMIFIVAPGPTGGNMRNFTPFCDGTTPLFDGVLTPAIGEWFTSDPIGEWSVAAHEIAHLTLAAEDMYIQPGNSNTEPNTFSLMGNPYTTSTYFDPMHRIAFGWAMPIELEEDGVLEIEGVRQSEQVYVLPRRKGGDGLEYILLENRQDSDFDWKYDENIHDSGIAVWHVVEKPDQQIYAPICVDQQVWENVTNNPVRRGVRLIRPRFYSTDVDQSLWDSSNYELLNHDPVCPGIDNEPFYRNILQWADGTAAEWQLLNFSAPGPVMSVLVEKLF